MLEKLWNSAPAKDSRLRQIIMDMRSSFAEIDAEGIIIKKYGKFGIDTNMIEIPGDISSIPPQFGFA